MEMTKNNTEMRAILMKSISLIFKIGIFSILVIIAQQSFAEERTPQMQIGNPNTRCGRMLRTFVNDFVLPHTGIGTLSKAYMAALRETDLEKKPGQFWANYLKQMDMKVDVKSEAIKNIPENGPALIFSNHPTGVMDGPILLSAVHERRSDVKVIMTDLMDMPGVQDQIIAVKIMGKNASEKARANLSAMKEAAKWLKEGHAVVVFPAGEVSHVTSRAQLVAMDSDWNKNLTKLAKMGDAPVVSAYIHGQNDRLFQLSGLVPKVGDELRTAQLGRTGAKLAGETVALEIAAPVPQKALAAIGDEASEIEYLKARTYSQKFKRDNQGGHRDESHFSPIAKGHTSDMLVNAVHVLDRNPNLVLHETDDLKVIAFSKKDFADLSSPQSFEILKDEIGRLREVTFRQVGEGSGYSRDLDAYDDYYTHLVVWNKAKNEMVGAYRMGFSDEIVAERGISGLYTSNQFKYDQKFLDSIGPALELGRSWVRAEYHGQSSGLPTLLKGIGITMAKRPQYRSFFGSVSISNEYHDLSKQVMMDYMMKNHSDSALSALVKPKNPPQLNTGMAPEMIASLEKGATDLNSMSATIAAIEPDGKGAPPLITTYTTLRTRFLHFDFDKDFNTVDGMIVTDMRQLATEQPAIVKRLMGKDHYERYMGVQPK